jgi:hypothetical protein
MQTEEEFGQIPRKVRYEREHPDVQIIYGTDHWQAVIPVQGGQNVITRFELGDLMDELESLDERA